MIPVGLSNPVLVEFETMKELAARLGPKALLRIDPNGRWREDTAVRIGQKLGQVPLEYYEDPVNGQSAMAAVRGSSSQKRIPGTLVAIDLNSPRISAGASGLGSNVSCCGGPPWSHR